MSNITSLTYFAKDGNYGDAAGLTVVDTTDWTDDDFEMLDYVGDERRVLAAQTISEWIEKGRTDEYDEFFERLGIERS
jgi:hypothetical protein